MTLLYQFHAQKALFKVPKICNINFWIENADWHFSPNNGLSGLVLPRIKCEQIRCLGSFLICGYQKFFSLPKMLGFLAQIIAKLGPKLAFLDILSQILAFLAHLVPYPTKKQCEGDSEVMRR